MNLKSYTDKYLFWPANKISLENFARGWIIGDFEPSLVKTKDVEIGVIELTDAHIPDYHFHLDHTEYNVVLDGWVETKGKDFFENDIFIFKPGEKSDVRCVSAMAKLLVIKTPATKNDKHYD
jgi:hypothetical protein